MYRTRLLRSAARRGRLLPVLCETFAFRAHRLAKRGLCALLLGFGVLLIGCARTAAGEKRDSARTEPVIPPALPVLQQGAADAAAPDQTFLLTGVAAAVRTSRLSAKGSGILRSIKVREGDRVKAGQVMCVLDPTDVANHAQSAKVAHEQATTAMANAEKDLERAEALYDAGVLTDDTMEKAQLGMRMAKLQAQAAEVGVRMANQALADTTLRAPFAGVVTRVMAEEGQLITTMPPSPIFEIADTDTLEVRVQIPERRLADIKPDLPVIVELPAVGVRREAKIDRISEVVDPYTRSAEAVIQLHNRDHSLPAGLFARVTFPSVPAESTHQVPDLPEPATDARANGDR